MDFVILKVNGQDVSNSSHEDAVRCFQSAQEPILVEVLRRHPSTLGPTSGASTTTSTSAAAGMSSPQEDEQLQQQQQRDNHENTFTLLVSTGVQTDWVGLIDEDDFMPVTLHADEQTNDSFDDILAPEIDFEEVTLQKTASAEKLGLTVCYSSGSGSEDADTEVYISEIVPESLAARDGRLREGDQILRVNGRDVATKEQTENLFAETKSAVTILVSRCLYPDDDYDDRRTYHDGSPTLSPDVTTPAYQNSMIEQLIRQQQQEEQEEAQQPKPSLTSEPSPAPPVPCHTQPPTAAAPFSTPSSTCSSQSGSQKSGGELEQQQRRKWMQEALKECSRRVDGMSLVAGQKQQLQQQTVKLVEAYSSHVWSDTEHIYETIPESDSEPIYSSPYEHQHWLHHQPNSNQVQGTVGNTQTASNGKPWHSSSKSNSSGEEKDSSSAYNTGESCNSNTLTLELQQPSEHHRSTLVLCPPKPPAAPPAPATSTPKMHCNCPVPLTPSSKSSVKTQISRQTRTPQVQAAPPQPPAPPPAAPPQSGVLAAETMYTNVANLQQTMRLQQQLFKQALSRRKLTAARDCGYSRRARAPSVFQAPNLAQYQFVASQVCVPAVSASQSWSQHQQQQHGSKAQEPETVQMEWKVKRRADGTRYIARRPVRNRILRNRALRINEERQGHTTEDDAMSEIKVGRYWSKEERKRQLERARERKQRQQELLQQQQIQQTSEQLICDFIEENKPSKKPPIPIDQSHKKTTRKKPPAEDFTTVQEILVHGNRVGANSQNTANKLMGLLSVTTV